MAADLTNFPLLSSINDPNALRALDAVQLPKLAAEIRQYMIDCLDQCGGHFGANMGAVEIAIALHYVYNTPHDQLVWDVGHQAYPHKILTGRRDLLHTVKQPNGLAPFPKRDESEYDNFGTGHSSTSISAALGMAIANKLDHDNDRRAIAIIGDGGLTGGIAFEALNHAGATDPNLLIILNDNDMSISENVGALTHYFARILSGKVYCSLREGSKKILEKMPPISRLAKRTETQVKSMITPGTLFEELGINYIGPIDGHDLPTLITSLQNLKNLQGAKLLHVITTKGKGYAPAENNQTQFHAVKPGFHSQTKPTQTNPIIHNTSTLSYSQTFGDWLCDMAEQSEQLIGITPAMCEGSGMQAFAKQYSERYFDVAIAEQHCLTFAAGLACQNKKPVVAIYSTFLQRAYDQLIHDIALQNLDVTFAIDRAGLVGADGPTHAGSFDLSFMRCIPNLVVMAPSNVNESRQMLSTAYYYNGPAAVRYPRGSGPAVTIEKSLQQIPIGKAQYCRHGEEIAILAFGACVAAAQQTGEALNASVINMRFIKPLDTELIAKLSKKYRVLVTVEENAIAGGAGSAVNEYLASINSPCAKLNLGLPDRFLEHGIASQMLAACGLDASGIESSIRAYLSKYVRRKSTT